MKKVITVALISTTWLYACLIGLWFILRLFWGDQFWWLALMNVFAPHLFLPLLLFGPLCLGTRRLMGYLGLMPPLVIFLWLYGALFLPGWPAKIADDVPLTIMSFNIWGGSRSGETARVILDNGVPDLVAIQELQPWMADVLLEEVGEFYPYHIFDTYWRSNGIGILSRYPLTELSSQLLFYPAWEIQIVEVMARNRAITVYNIHPHSSNVIDYLGVEYSQQLFDRIKQSFQTRQRLIQQLMADIRTRPGPVIVVGDFNSTDQSEVYTLLSSQLTDAHQAAGWGFGHTFPAYSGRFRRVPIPPRQIRIDMIFYSAHFVALQSWVSPSAGESDHLPVLAKIAWHR